MTDEEALAGAAASADLIGKLAPLVDGVEPAVVMVALSTVLAVTAKQAGYTLESYASNLVADALKLGLPRRPEPAVRTVSRRPRPLRPARHRRRA